MELATLIQQFKDTYQNAEILSGYASQAMINTVNDYSSVTTDLGDGLLDLVFNVRFNDKYMASCKLRFGTNDNYTSAAISNICVEYLEENLSQLIVDKSI